MKCILEMAKEKRSTLLWVILGIYGGCSISYLFNLMAGEIEISFSALMVPVFAAVLFLERSYILGLHSDKSRADFDVKAQKRRVLFTGVLSFMLGLSFVLGYQMAVLGMTSGGVKGKAFIFVVSLGIGVAFMPLVNYWFLLMDRIQAKNAVCIGRECIGEAGCEGDNACEGKKWTSGKTFLISWAVIFVAWIPLLLAFYPAIMSYDFHRQSQEAVMGTGWLNEHHPLAHTLLIRFFFSVGRKIGSYEVGMAIFSILQMLGLSVVMAYACAMVGRLAKKKRPVVVTVVNFAILPIHPILALSMTKDIIFTILFLLMILLFLEYNQSTNTKVKWAIFVALVVVGSVSMLYRNNAIYAFAAFAVFFVLWSKRERLVILLLCALILAGGKGLGIGVREAVSGNPGSSIEMFSVPLMQMTRVGVMHGENLPYMDYLSIDFFVDDVNWEHYTPAIADGVKSNVNVSSFVNWSDNKLGFFQYWAKIGLKYPNEYIDAFLALTSGYWFLDDVSHAEVLGYGDDSQLGLLYTFNASVSDVFEGVKSESFLPGVRTLYEKIVNGNAYYNWPVISNLFKPAFYAWALLWIMASLWYLKKGRKLLLCLLPFFYFGTLILGPVVNMRYLYPVIVTIPVLVAWLFSNCDWKLKDERKTAEEE